MATLRGGNEFGETWHQAGMLHQKQNVFDDFRAVIVDVQQRGYTDPQHTAISGRSNGGLLVGALLTQHPELVAAVVCGVPLLDMIRYPYFQIAGERESRVFLFRPGIAPRVALRRCDWTLRLGPCPAPELPTECARYTSPSADQSPSHPTP